MDPNQPDLSEKKEISPPIELTSLQTKSDRIQNRIGIGFAIFTFMFLIALIFIDAFINFQLGISFILGVFTQAYLMIRNRMNRAIILDFVICISLSFLLVFVLMSSSEGSSFSSPSGLLIPVGFAFSIIFSLMFKKKILFSIDEGTLSILNIVFLYLYFLRFGFYNILTFVFLIIIITSFIKIIPSSVPSFFWKVFLYCWVLFILIFLSLYQFNSNIFTGFTNGSLQPINTYLNATFIGMTLLSVTSYLLFIVTIFLPIIPFKMNLRDLIPFNRTVYDFNKRFERTKNIALDLSSKYDDRQLPLLKMLFLISLTSGCLIINYLYKFMPDLTLISLIMVISFNFLEFSKANDPIIENHSDPSIVTLSKN
jgi:hypothetical protein